MLYVLLILIVFLIVLNYSLLKDVLSPSLLLCGVFAVSTVFSIIGNAFWEAEISFFAIFTIWLCLFLLCIGEIFARSGFSFGHSAKLNERRLNVIDKYELIYSKGLMLFLSVFCIIVCYLQYRNILQLAYSVGYQSGNGNLLEAARWAMQAGNSGSIIVNILVFASRGIGFICSSVFINNIFSCGKLTLGIKKNFILLIPILTLLFSTILSTSRNGLIGLIIMFFFYVFDCVRVKRKLNIGKIFKWGVASIVVFLLVFSILGKSRGQSATLDTICIYAGSSIVAFSVWFSKGMNGSGSLFGSESFVGVHELIARFFPNYKDLSLFDKFITFPNGSQTNIYTAFKAWIADFSWVGCLIFCLSVGFFFGIIYLKTIYKKYDSRTCLFRCVYAYFLYYLIYSFATPELTTSFLSVTQLMEFFFIFVFYYLIFVSLNRRKKINGIQK